MNRQRFDENASPTGSANRGVDYTLLCSTSGCGRRWTCDFGKRLCSDCDARRHNGHAQRAPQRQASIASLPTLREAVRPYAEPVEHDEEYRHAD